MSTDGTVTNFSDSLFQLLGSDTEKADEAMVGLEVKEIGKGRVW